MYVHCLFNLSRDGLFLHKVSSGTYLGKFENWLWKTAVGGTYYQNSVGSGLIAAKTIQLGVVAFGIQNLHGCAMDLTS
jgi:hypothetical protein